MRVRSLPVRAQSSGQYTIFGQIGAGGMASILYAHFVGPGGFSRPVSIKRLHPQFANDPGFASAFLDEARLSARIAHTNVVATLDVLSGPDEISVVMEYVHGESLAGLLTMARARARDHGAALPYRIAVNLIAGVLHGLHAAHETCNERGEPLGIVHRDVSPENILVGSDGVARLLDFGIAKAKGRSRTTPTGELKGKLGYMAPEQYQGEDVDRRVDVYSASVVLWEALAGQVLFDGGSDAAVVHAVMNAEVRAPSELSAGLPKALDALVMRGLSRDRSERFDSAHDMALALEREVGAATRSEVCDWLQELAGELLQNRAAALAQLHATSAAHGPELGTRKLPANLAAGQPLPALGVESAPASPQGSQSGLRLRSVSVRRGWTLAALAVLSASAWLAFALREPAAGPQPSPAAAAAPRAQALPSIAAPRPPEPSLDTLEPPRVAAESAATPDVAAAISGGRPAETRESKSKHGLSERAGVRAKSKSATHPKLDCSPPYVIDALGIRHMKRECL